MATKEPTMKEYTEFRIFQDYFHLLPKPNNAKFNGMVYVIEVSKEDPLYEEIGRLNKQVKEKFNKYFFGYFKIKRSYTKKEIDRAALFQVIIKTTFEPAGEECGTLYDETVACNICGANRKQNSSLMLMKGSIPKKDIARTIAGEVVVSEKFAEAFKQSNLKGAELEPVVFAKGTSGYFQIKASSELELTGHTVAGGDPFDFLEGSEGVEFAVSGGYPIKFDKEVYKCPKGHTIGLNLLSEAYIINSPLINNSDFFASNQKIGVKRGLLRPEPIYFCSPAFRQMIEEEKLSGFEFEIANIE